MKAKNSKLQRTDSMPKIGNPATRALANAGYSRLMHLTKVTEAELLKLHGMGPKAIRILKESLKARGMSFAGAGKPRVKKEASLVSAQDISDVDEFMYTLKHPFKAEVRVVRDIIKGVNKNIAEEIKWKAPTFSYKGEYLVTFNLWEMKRVHLVFHNPLIARVKSKFLEGDYSDRRMMYFTDMKDVKAKRPALKKALKDLIHLEEKHNG